MWPPTLRVLLSIALCMCSFELAVGAGAVEGPNFIFILADDVSWPLVLLEWLHLPGLDHS